MFARRLVRTSATFPYPLHHRSFVSSSSISDPARSPGLGDVIPSGVDFFNSRQKEFRDNLDARRKDKEQADSQSLATPDPLSSAQKPTSDAGTSGGGSSKSFHDAARQLKQPPRQGSLTLRNTTGEARKEEQDAASSKRKGGALSNLIYGTAEGQQMDKDMERSFSQVLARGKYVHSIVFHDVKPDKVDEYVQLVGSWYPRMASMPENKVNLVGSWRSEVGDCDTFVHIWEYQRYTGYHTSLHNISNHPEFPAFDKHLKSLITSKKTSLMQEFSFWPTTPPRRLGGLFELRSYTLHPGNLLEWETHWRKGLQARREVMEGVGAWFCQIGDLNTVHHLWQFADLEERKVQREKSWGIEGWADTVHKTVPLIQTMKSKILVPMQWSPVG